jgi:hypothetical protein
VKVDKKEEIKEIEHKEETLDVKEEEIIKEEEPEVEEQIQVVEEFEKTEEKEEEKSRAKIDEVDDDKILEETESEISQQPFIEEDTNVEEFESGPKDIPIVEPPVHESSVHHIPPASGDSSDSGEEEDTDKRLSIQKTREEAKELFDLMEKEEGGLHHLAINDSTIQT